MFPLAFNLILIIIVTDNYHYAWAERGIYLVTTIPIHMSLHFYAYARKGYEFIDEVARELNSTDTDKAGRITRCVIRALRNRITIEESFSLITQLPMALKGVYVDGWKNDDLNNSNGQNIDFIKEVFKEDDNSAWRDFSNEDEVKLSIIAVLKVLSQHILVPEFENIIALLPTTMQIRIKSELREMLKP